MNKSKIGLICVAVIAGLIMVSTVTLAGGGGDGSGVMNPRLKKEMKKAVSDPVSGLAGTISVIRGEKDKMTAMALTDKDGTVYHITLNAAAKSLGLKDGQEVQLKGSVEEMDGKKWLTLDESKDKASSPRKKKNK